MAPLFGPNYNDEELATRAQQTLIQEPLVSGAQLGVTSEDGIVTLTGTAQSETEKERAARTIRQTFETAGLEFDQIVNEITVS